MTATARRVAVLAAASSMWLLAGSAAAEEPMRCYGYAEGDKLGRMDSGKIDEASGMVASLDDPGIYWIHNDSGDDERIFAVDDDGTYFGQWRVKSADAEDWEDIALGPCADGTWRCLYIADLGNNKGKRDDFSIYRVAEPAVDRDRDKAHDGDTERADEWRIVFDLDADEREQLDIEAIWVDLDGTIYIFAKYDDGVDMFAASPPTQDEGDADVVARWVGYRDDIDFVTGADVSPDGWRFILRNDDFAWEFVLNPSFATTAEVFTGEEPLKTLLRTERQGEAIAYTPYGEGFLTTSERTERPIYYYECLSFDGPVPTDGKEDNAGGGGGAPEDSGCAGSSSPLGLFWLLAVAALLSGSRRLRPQRS